MQQKGELALRSGESRGKMFGSKVLEKEAIRRTCLALLALVLAGVLLVLWAGPADAATTFTVNFTGDANDRRITDLLIGSPAYYMPAIPADWPIIGCPLEPPMGLPTVTLSLMEGCIVQW